MSLSGGEGSVTSWRLTATDVGKYILKHTLNMTFRVIKYSVRVYIDDQGAKLLSH